MFKAGTHDAGGADEMSSVLRKKKSVKSLERQGHDLFHTNFSDALEKEEALVDSWRDGGKLF